jgi:phosphoglycolate phosphatase
MLALGLERFRAILDLAGSEAALLWQETVGFEAGARRIDPHGPLATAPAREEMILTAGALYRNGQPWLQAIGIATRAYALADERLVAPYGAVLLEGIQAALIRLRNAGFRMAIATTDRRQRTQQMAHALGLAPYLDTVVCVDDVPKGKPAPDMALEVCRRLDLEPYQVAVVGDTESDMRMGRAAGVAACVGIRSGMNKGAGLAGLADVVLDSVAQLSSE